MPSVPSFPFDLTLRLFSLFSEILDNASKSFFDFDDLFLNKIQFPSKVPLLDPFGRSSKARRDFIFFDLLGFNLLV